MPKLWTETIEAHRAAVRDATLDTVGALVAEYGLDALTMSLIAEKTGIGRATLYKYFPDVGAILFAWHERQITSHLEHLMEIRNRAGNAGERLQAVLEGLALISHQTHGHSDTEFAVRLHRGGHVVDARRQLGDLVCDLLTDAIASGDVRDDIPPGELAHFCLHALTAAGRVPSRAAVDRLVTVTLEGLRPHR